MTTTNRLAIVVDSTDTARAAKSLDELAVAGGKAEKSTTALTKATTVLSNAAKYAAGAFGLLSAGMAAREAVQMADSYTKLTAQLTIATKSATEYNMALLDVKRISSTAQADIIATAQLYGKLSLSLAETGRSQVSIARITETVSLGLKVNGASAQEASSAMLQLSQAFGSGVLRGEEFNAVSEAAPNLLRTLAASMGVTYGELRKIASEGKITSDVLARAFSDEKTLAGLRKQAESMQTISGAMVELKNQTMLAVGEFMKSSGATSSIAGVLDKLASTITNIGNALTILAAATAVYSGVLASQLVVNVTTSIASFVALNAAHGQALTMNVALARAEQARLVTMLETNSANMATVASELAYVKIMESVAATTERANAFTAQRIALQGRLAAMEEAGVIAESQLAAATNATASAQTLATASGSIWTKTLFGTSVSANLASGALSKLSLALNVLMAAWVGWEIGTWLRSFEEVRVVGMLMIGQFMKGFENIKFGAQVAGAAIAAMAPNGEAFATAYARISAAHDAEINKIEEQTQAFAEMETSAARVTQEIAKPATVIKPATTAITDHQKAITSMIAALEKESATYGMTAAQVKIYEAEQLVMTENELAHAIALIKGVEAREAATKAEEALQKQLESGTEAYNKYWGSVEESTAKLIETAKQQEFENTLIGKTKDEIAELTRLRKNSTITIAEETLATIKKNASNSDAITLLKEIRAQEEYIAALKRNQSADNGKSAAEATAKQVEEETKLRTDMWKKVDDVARDTFVNIWGHGKSTLDRLSDTLKNGLLAMLYEMGKKQFMINIGVTGAGMGVSGAAQAASGASSFGGMLDVTSLIGGSLGTFGTGIASAMSTGIVAGFGNGMAALGLGQIGAGLGMIAPGLAIGAAVLSSLLGSKGTPTASTGDASMNFSASGEMIGRNLMGNYTALASDAADAFVKKMNEGYLSAAKNLGLTAMGTTFAFAANTGKDSKQPMFGIGGGVAGGTYYNSAETVTSDAAVMLEQSRAIFTALRDSVDESSQYLMSAFGLISDVGAASQQQIDAAIGFAQALYQTRAALTETRTPLQMLAESVTSGMAALGTSAETFKTDFVAAIDTGALTPELLSNWTALGNGLQQLAQASAQAASDVANGLAQMGNTGFAAELANATATATMGAVQAAMPWITSMEQLSTISAADFAQYGANNQALIAAAVTAAAQAQQYAASPAEQAPPAMYVTASDYTVQTAHDNSAQLAIEQERANLQSQLNALTDTAAQALTRQRDALDESNRALFDQIQAINDSAAAAAAAAALAKTNFGIQQQIDVLMGTQTQRQVDLTNALEGVDASTAALITQLFGLQDAAAAASDAAATAAAAAAHAQVMGGLNVQLMRANGEDSAAIALERQLALAQIADAEQAALQEQVWAAQDAAAARAEADRVMAEASAQATRAAEEAARAAEQLKSAWQSVTDTIFDEVARIRGLMGQGGMADAQSRFAIATAQARAGDQEAARLLPALSQAMLEMAAASASTAAELARMQGRTAASLTTTGESLAARYGLTMPSYAVGTPSVPFDMVAQIHKGERIIPAASNDALLDEIRALRQEVAGLRASSEKTAESTGKTTNILRNVTQDGNSLLTTAA